jgi:hypothetical protein
MLQIIMGTTQVNRTMEECRFLQAMSTRPISINTKTQTLTLEFQSTKDTNRVMTTTVIMIILGKVTNQMQVQVEEAVSG